MKHTAVTLLIIGIACAVATLAGLAHAEPDIRRFPLWKYKINYKPYRSTSEPVSYNPRDGSMRKLGQDVSEGRGGEARFLYRDENQVEHTVLIALDHERFKGHDFPDWGPWRTTLVVTTDGKRMHESRYPDVTGTMSALVDPFHISIDDGFVTVENKRLATIAQDQSSGRLGLDVELRFPRQAIGVIKIELYLDSEKKPLFKHEHPEIKGVTHRERGGGYTGPMVITVPPYLLEPGMHTIYVVPFYQPSIGPKGNQIWAPGSGGIPKVSSFSHEFVPGKVGRWCGRFEEKRYGDLTLAPC